MNEDLPTYSEAEALRLNPRYLSFKRHSAPANCYTIPSSSSGTSASAPQPTLTIQEDAEAEAREAGYLSPPPTYSPSEVFHIQVPPPASAPEGPHGPFLFPIIPEGSSPPRRHSDVPPATTPIPARGTPYLTAEPASRMPSALSRPPTRDRNNDFTEVNLRSSATRRLSASVVQPLSRPTTTSLYVRTYSSSSFESESEESGVRRADEIFKWDGMVTSCAQFNGKWKIGVGISWKCKSSRRNKL